MQERERKHLKRLRQQESSDFSRSQLEIIWERRQLVCQPHRYIPVKIKAVWSDYANIEFMGNKQEFDSIVVFTAKFPYPVLHATWHDRRSLMVFSIKTCPGGQRYELLHKT